jgi:HlyD family secretion protein
LALHFEIAATQCAKTLVNSREIVTGGFRTVEDESDVDQAKQELERVVSQNERKMLQYLADLTAQSNTLALSEQKLERDRKNLQGTKIYAPQDGLVVYSISDSHFSSESLIEGGASVRNRQELIKLPDLSRMKVNIKVHESHVNMIRPGLPAYVVLDSMPDQRFAAQVEKVAPLPDTQARWGNPNLKVYNTEVWVTDPLPNVKPGVSATAEIIITNIANTLFVPIQAVTSFKGKQVVYLASGAKSEPITIDGGMYNTKYIQITKGVKEGDRVLLSPPFDTQKDLEGAVLAADEKADVARTNTAPRTGTTPGRVNAGADGAVPGQRPVGVVMNREEIL